MIFDSILSAIRSVTAWVRGEQKKEADANHEANKAAAEAEVARREAAAREKTP